MNKVGIGVQIIVSGVIVRNRSEKAAVIVFSYVIITILLNLHILIDLILHRGATLKAPLSDLHLSFKEPVELFFKLQLLFSFEVARVFEP